MPKEIERKFLLTNDEWRKNAEGESYKQGYLSTVAERSVRIRIKSNKGFLTVKVKTTGFSRSAFSYDAPGGLRCPSTERNLEPSHIALEMPL